MEVGGRRLGVGLLCSTPDCIVRPVNYMMKKSPPQMHPPQKDDAFELPVFVIGISLKKNAPVTASLVRERMRFATVLRKFLLENQATKKTIKWHEVLGLRVSEVGGGASPATTQEDIRAQFSPHPRAKDKAHEDQSEGVFGVETLLDDQEPTAADDESFLDSLVKSVPFLVLGIGLILMISVTCCLHLLRRASKNSDRTPLKSSLRDKNGDPLAGVKIDLKKSRAPSFQDAWRTARRKTPTLWRSSLAQKLAQVKAASASPQHDPGRYPPQHRGRSPASVRNVPLDFDPFAPTPTAPTATGERTALSCLPSSRAKAKLHAETYITDTLNQTAPHFAEEDLSLRRGRLEKALELGKKYLGAGDVRNAELAFRLESWKGSYLFNTLEALEELLKEAAAKGPASSVPNHLLPRRVNHLEEELALEAKIAKAAEAVSVALANIEPGFERKKCGAILVAAARWQKLVKVLRRLRTVLEEQV